MVSIRVPADELLHQVARSMSRDTLFRETVIPYRSTWKEALKAVESSLGDSDQEVSFGSQPRFHKSRILQRVALANARSPLSNPNAQSTIGLPIRTTAVLKEVGPPTKGSEHVRRQLVKEAKSWPDSPPPNTLDVRATITERTLAVVSANLKLSGLDSLVGDPFAYLPDAELLWDTGAHSTVIVDEVLPEAFREYLKQPENDCYRTAGGTRVQIDALIAFSNQVMEMSCVCVVVPRSAVPNAPVGIILGQCLAINRIVYKSVPREILVALGEDVPETIWGDIVIEECINVNGDLEKF